MEIDTDTVRQVGRQLGVVAQGWQRSPMAAQDPPWLQGAFGTTPLGAELAEGLHTFSRRGRAALGALADRALAAAAALERSAAQFEAIEGSTGPR